MAFRVSHAGVRLRGVLGDGGRHPRLTPNLPGPPELERPCPWLRCQDGGHPGRGNGRAHALASSPSSPHPPRGCWEPSAREKPARSILSFFSYALSAVQDDNFQALQEGAVY
jgi:hypothetical protein